MTRSAPWLLALLLVTPTARAADPWVVYEGGEGPGKGKQIVLISGDEEYRNEGLRRLLVNACIWSLGLEDRIAQQSNVETVGTFEALPFKSGGYKKGVRPEDHGMR